MPCWKNCLWCKFFGDDSAAEEELVKHEAELSREAVIESSVCEVLPGCGQSSDCQSLCYADENKASNAQTLLSMANTGKNFLARCLGHLAGLFCALTTRKHSASTVC